MSFSYLINDVLPGFLEELRCTICKGLDPRIALFGIAAEASTRRCRACRSISLLASSTALATRNNTPYSVSSGPDWCSVFTWVFLRARSRSTPSSDEDVLAVVSESLGYQVVTAVNATQALEFLEGDQPVDVLLSDVIMPGGMNGAQLAVEARERSHRRPQTRNRKAIRHLNQVADHRDALPSAALQGYDRARRTNDHDNIGRWRPPRLTPRAIETAISVLATKRPRRSHLVKASRLKGASWVVRADR